MNIEIVLTIVVILMCILFLMINKNNDENNDDNNDEDFKSEYRESDIILPTPVPQFQYNLDSKKDLIIGNEDKNNNFPINIETPPEYKNTKPNNKNAPFADSNFIRDSGVVNSMKKKIQFDDADYKKVVDGVIEFNYPKNSQDLLTRLDIKSVSKDEFENSTLFNIYDRAVSKVINDITPQQIDNITGKYNMNDNNNNVLTNLYKPIFVSMDL